MASPPRNSPSTVVVSFAGRADFFNYADSLVRVRLFPLPLLTFTAPDTLCAWWVRSSFVIPPLCNTWGKRRGCVGYCTSVTTPVTSFHRRACAERPLWSLTRRCPLRMSSSGLLGGCLVVKHTYAVLPEDTLQPQGVDRAMDTPCYARGRSSTLRRIPHCLRRATTARAARCTSRSSSTGRRRPSTAAMRREVRAAIPHPVPCHHSGLAVLTGKPRVCRMIAGTQLPVAAKAHAKYGSLTSCFACLYPRLALVSDSRTSSVTVAPWSHNKAGVTGSSCRITGCCCEPCRVAS